MATDASTGNVLATEHTALSEGETFTWTLYLVPLPGEEMGSGTVVLRNGLDRVIEVSLSGQTSAVLAARSPPGASAPDRIGRSALSLFGVSGIF